MPRFHHVPLLLGPGGERLAKRHGAVTIAALRAAGADPAAVVGYLAALSGPVLQGTRITPRELVDLWDPARVPRHPVRVDPRDLAALAEGRVPRG
nr:MAG: hypothetical protein DIU70_10460 [Bacillota bacterium]